MLNLIFFFMLLTLSPLLPLNILFPAMLTQEMMLLNIHNKKFADSLSKFAPFLLELSSLLKSLILLNNKKKVIPYRVIMKSFSLKPV